MDTSPVYTRMHLIGNLNRHWFITTRKFSMPSLLVIRNFSRLYLSFRSAPAKHRRLMKAFISILSLSLVSLARLEMGWIRIYWFMCWKMSSKISSVMKYFRVSKGEGVFLAWPVIPSNFVWIFCHLLRLHVEHLSSHHFLFSFLMETIASSLQFSATMFIRWSASVV